MEKYAFCFGVDTAVIGIGFMQLNAALYFWARVSTMEPIYTWVDIVIAACYTVRATYFFLMLNQDCSQKSRQDYLDYNVWTSYGLGASGLAIITLMWLEWGHPPTWQFVSWGLVAFLNWYHYGFLQRYVSAAGSSDSKVELADADDYKEDLAEEDDADELINANKMD